MTTSVCLRISSFGTDHYSRELQESHACCSCLSDRMGISRNPLACASSGFLIGSMTAFLHTRAVCMSQQHKFPNRGAMTSVPPGIPARHTQVLTFLRRKKTVVRQ